MTCESDGTCWLSNLVTESLMQESGGMLNKMQRIEKRNKKKMRRSNSIVQSRRKLHNAFLEHEEDKQLNKGHSKNMGSSAVDDVGENMKVNVGNQKVLERLNVLIASIVQRQIGYSDEERKPSTLTPDERKSKRKQPMGNQSDSNKKGKAVAGPIMPESLLQPRKKDYGGLGQARPSLFLDLRDESFKPKLEEEFYEHINGFYGKIRTKAMKKQTEGNMLWRQLLEHKQGKNVTEKTEGKSKTKKLDGAVFSKMTPDQRVEAIIKAGMI